MNIQSVKLTFLSSILVALSLTMRAGIITATSVMRKSIKPVAFVRNNSMLRNTLKSVNNIHQQIMPQPVPIPGATIIRQIHIPKTTTRLMSTVGGSGKQPDILHINREQMEEIVEDYESGGRDESQYCIIDVRTEEEVRSTGKISENVYTLPVQVIMQSKVFDMDPDEFEEFCKFPKPTYDETIVFTCAAGMRSVSACHFAAQSGYTKLINYTGGANEWFSPSRF
jgi:rhodanese-related sulfurtransferase